VRERERKRERKGGTNEFFDSPRAVVVGNYQKYEKCIHFQQSRTSEKSSLPKRERERERSFFVFLNLVAVELFRFSLFLVLQQRNGACRFFSRIKLFLFLFSSRLSSSGSFALWS